MKSTHAHRKQDHAAGEVNSNSVPVRRLSRALVLEALDSIFAYFVP